MRKKMKFLNNPFSFSKNNRKVGYDFLKVIAMFLVVIDHLMQKTIINPDKLLIYNIIFLIQMPLFFFVSGRLSYLSSLRNKNDFFVNLKKLVISLLIPYVTFNLLFCLIRTGFTSLYFRDLLNYLIHPTKSLWFLFALFVIKIVFLVSEKLSSTFQNGNKKLITTIFYACICVIFLLIYLFIKPFSILKLIIYYSIFFILGYLSDSILNKICNDKVLSVVAMLITSVIFILILLLNINFHSEDDSLKNIALRLIGSSSIIILLSILANKISMFLFVKKISKIGELSLELYFVHVLLFTIFESAFIRCDISASGFLLFVAQYLICISLSFCFIFAIRSIKLLNFIFFGKRN